jgi:ATP synthase protein I
MILCGVLFGKWLDKTIFENEKQIFTIVFSLLSVFAAMYNVIRQLKSINK